MNVWHPRAERVIPLNAGPGLYVAGSWRQVLHTTEARIYSPNRSSYYGHQNWPHSTAALVNGVGRLFQHYPIDRSARALKNAPGGVETGRLKAVQIEIAWTAADTPTIPDALLDVVRDWVGWVAGETGSPLTAPRFVAGGYGETAAQRMSPSAWLAFSGVCGHQHVPENAHWDPGAFPWSRLIAQGDDDMPTPSTIVDALVAPDGKGVWLLQYDGGVITKNGAPFFGSYPGLPPEHRRGERNFVAIEPHQGGYALVAADGAVYRFAAKRAA